MKRKKLKEVIKTMDNVVNYYSSKINNYDDRDDVKQNLYCQIIEAYKKYDHKHAIKTFFVPVIRNELNRILLNYNKCNKRFDDIVKYFETYFFKEYTESYSPETLYFNKTIKKLKENFLNELKQRTKLIAQYYLEGFKTKEIAKKIRLSISAINGIRKLEIQPAFYKYFAV